jgi:peroxiredoxin
MSGRKAKAARQAERAAPPVRSKSVNPSSWWMSWKGALIALAVVAVMGASFVLPDRFEEQSGTAASPAGAPAMSHGDGGTTSRDGDGLTAGSPVPTFTESDVLTGRPITSKALAAKKTLLFFSEGVMCQACFEQIKGLEQMGGELDRRGIQLVSITPDSPENLKQAIAQFGIATPMIADEDRDMSAAFDTLGQGMHADTPGHAFALIERGKVLWYRDYWLPPDRTMYVEPAKVLADLASA